MFRYYSTQRPVMPGGFPNKESVKKIENFESRIFCEEIGRPAWGYIEYNLPLLPSEASRYELIAAKTGCETFDNVERYMEMHDFLAADKRKVRNFLKSTRATDATITRTEILYRECGVIGRISRTQLGIQDNFK